MRHKIFIGTRGSELALRQAEIVKRALESLSDVMVNIKIIKTEGDSNFSPIPLDTVGKGWFTKEIEKELLEHSIDIAVHSLKDLPEVLPEGLHIASYLDREDPRDVLLGQKSVTLETLESGAVIGTDSLRRKVQILALRPDLQVESIRGNVLTRIEKLDNGNYDAIVIAAAGVIRLGLEDRINQYFSIEEVTPAPGQGILAVETRIDDAKTYELVQKINDGTAHDAALAERSFSSALGGGCKMPLGAYATVNHSELMLEGMLADETGRIVRSKVSGARNEAAQLGKKLADAIR